MFDRVGRVLCAECGGRMNAVEIARGAALFVCEDCSHALAINWATPKEKGGRSPPPLSRLG
jgi:hypothetical protein